MGRRKIAIKAIKDDRNRSVTFLKRKGGLFKKAHELSVLCSVDVAVIIFGSNKKLYEFSSGNIHETLSRYHYSQPHEHKGPGDFADKDGGDDDDDEDIPMEGTPPQDMPSPPQHGVVQYPLQDQPGLQHMRHRSTPSASASPPMGNGAFQPHRLSTPQPPHPGSRPSSRNHVRRQSSNLVPQNHPHPQAAQQMQQYSNYLQQTHPQYASQQGAYMRGPQGTPPMHTQPMHTPPMQHHHFTHPQPQPPPNAQMQQLYLQEQRRSSMPPTIPMHTQAEHHQNMPMMHTPPQPSRPFQSPPLPGPSPQPLPRQRVPDQPPPGYGMMREHGTPDMRQQQQQQWQHPSMGMRQSSQPDIRQEIKEEDSGSRPPSMDAGMAMRSDGDDGRSNYGSHAGSTPMQHPNHASHASTGSMPAPSRVNSMQASRPKLSVQIPGEAAEGAPEQSVEDSSRETSSKTTSTPAKPGSSETTHHSNLVLPAPSPRSASAGAVLSAGATGPSNPFARPNIPKKQESNNDAFKDASPMSALPSRVMQEHGYMSSPSSMFPELGFGPMHNTLASPAVYQPTPINYHGPSFRDEPPDKRKKSPSDEEGGAAKKPRSG